jgi:hypothetical protein
MYPALHHYLHYLTHWATPNENTFNNLNFELPKDSEHGIWIQHRYVNNEARSFDVHICASFSKPQDIDMNTDVYYIESQGEKKLLSRKAIYAMHDNEGAIQYQINDSILDKNVERENDLAANAHILYDTVNTDGWDLCTSIEIQFSTIMSLFHLRLQFYHAK